METLGQKQQRFLQLTGLLFNRLHQLGYQATYGETMRSDEQAEINALGFAGRERLAKMVEKEFPALAEKIRNNGKANGIRLSVHQLKLAVDVNLFKDGKYLPNTDDHKVLGQWWETLAPDCRWGGRWGDGNHYSIEHEGIK